MPPINKPVVPGSSGANRSPQQKRSDFFTALRSGKQKSTDSSTNKVNESKYRRPQSKKLSAAGAAWSVVGGMRVSKKEVSTKNGKPSYLANRGYIDVSKLSQEVRKHDYHGVFPGSSAKEREEAIKKLFKNKKLVSPQEVRLTEKRLKRETPRSPLNKGDMKKVYTKKLFEKFFPTGKP